MARKTKNTNFEQTLDLLRAHSFDVAPYSEVAGSVLVSKDGAGAVLLPVKDGPAAFLVAPGALLGGELARLLDRGYQKFIRTAQYEVPATASQLQSIHRFADELKQLTGAMNLYNESLGTTSDLYEYDRLKGREALQPDPPIPWQATGAH